MEKLQISLAAARVNARLTQAEAAEKLGVSKQTIMNWEKSVTTPNIEQAHALSDLYGIPLDNIFFDRGIKLNLIYGKMDA